MEDTNKSEEFKFTYSAREQEELRKIRQKYVPKEVDRMEQLRKLDAGVTRKAVVIIGALLRRAKIASSRKLEIGDITCSRYYWSTCSRIWNEPYHDRCWRNVRTLWKNSGGFGSCHGNDRCRTCKCGISNL